MELEQKTFTWGRAGWEGLARTLPRLGDVREALGKQRAQRQPADLQKDPASLQMGVSPVRGLYSRDLFNPYLLTPHAQRQLVQRVLPSRFFPGLQKLARLDGGEELACQVWSRFAEESDPVVCRTAHARIGGRKVRYVRGVLSLRYQCYDNHHLVHDFTEAGGELGTLPVLDWWVADEAFRLRLAVLSHEKAMLLEMTDSVIPGSVIPVIEIWNSEVGLRSVGVRASLVLVHTLTGMRSQEGAGRHTWAHRGRQSLLRRKTSVSFSRVIREAQELESQYLDAQTPAEDPAEVLRSTSAGQPESTIQTALLLASAWAQARESEVTYALLAEAVSYLRYGADPIAPALRFSVGVDLLLQAENEDWAGRILAEAGKDA
jgi:hypothetical protein